jgi:hypothetical protein
MVRQTGRRERRTSEPQPAPRLGLEPAAASLFLPHCHSDLLLFSLMLRSARIAARLHQESRAAITVPDTAFQAAMPTSATPGAPPGSTCDHR